MHTETLFVRRAATVSPQEAKARLAEKYPGYTVKNFKVESSEDGEFYTAALTRQAEHPEIGAEPLDVGPEPEADESPDSPEPEDKPEPKEDKGDDSGLEHKLDKIVDMLQTLVGGGDPETPESPVDSKPLPPPVKEPHGMPSGPSPMGMFGSKRYLTVVRDNSKTTKMVDAKTELDKEFAPHGFKVAKMVRKDDTIVAGLVRSNWDQWEQELNQQEMAAPGSTIPDPNLQPEEYQRWLAMQQQHGLSPAQLPQNTHGI